MALSDPQPIGSTNGDRLPLDTPEIDTPEIDTLEPGPGNPTPRFRLAAALLFATFVTTLLAGIQLQNDFLNNQPLFTFSQGILPLAWIAQQPSRLYGSVQREREQFQRRHGGRLRDFVDSAMTA